MWNQSQQGSKQNGFAGAVRPDDREGFALFECEGDILENGETVQCHGQVFDGQDGVIGHVGLESTYLTMVVVHMRHWLHA